MKKHLLVFLFLAGCTTGWAQKVVVEPYVIGLVEDYKGRHWLRDHPQETSFVDRFHHTEGRLVTYLDSLITEANKRTYDKTQLTLTTWEQKNCFYCAEFRLMHSVRLASEVNQAFTFKLDKDQNKGAQKVYVGKLKPQAFKTPQEKASFLAGAYVRYGVLEDGTYKIRLHGSASKFEAILRELKALRCDITNVAIGEGAQEDLQQVSFVPTEVLKAYLDRQEHIRKDILAKKAVLKKPKVSADLFQPQS